MIFITTISHKLSFRSSYFTSFSAHVSQYFSISIIPSPTVNNASCVALLPQVIQNFVFPLLSLNDLNIENIFSILLLHSYWYFIGYISWQYYNHDEIMLQIDANRATAPKIGFSYHKGGDKLLCHI